MANIDELEEYVKTHPTDHEQRWRLAKKLYKACEYRRALEHLNVVNEEWRRRLNVLRYLAAAHYRLGQHEQAIQVLEYALQYWPQEVGAREQLARVLEASDRHDEAATVWQIILELDPKHPLARQSVKRLLRQPDPSATSELGLVENDSGIGLTSGWTCANCGATNTAEFERCWQCHAAASGARTPTPRPAQRVQRLSNPWVRTLIVGLALAAVLCWGLFLFLTHLAAVVSGDERVLADGTFHGLFAQKFFTARALITLAFLLAWPQIIRGALFLLKTPRVPRANVTLAGLLPAASLYVALWTTPELLPYALLTPLILSAAAIAATFPIGPKKAAAVWATQSAVACLVLAGCLLLSLRFYSGAIPPLKDLMLITNTVRIHDAGAPSSRRIAENLRTPATVRMQWQSSGSPWLDALAETAVFEFSAASGSTLNIVLAEDGETAFSSQVETFPFRLPWNADPRRTYELTITSRPDVDVGIVVFSVLPTTPLSESDGI